MAAVYLLVTDGAIAEAGRTQIMERRRHNAHHDGSLPGQSGKVGVAFETHEAHFLTDQHLRVRRTVRHVAALAAFLPHRSVLEGERAAFVAMAFETARLIGARQLHEARFEAAVRIVSIHAGHGIFGNAVFEGLGKRRFYIDVAALALCIYVGEFAGHEAVGTVRVNRMALSTRDRIVRVAGFEPARRGRLIAVAGETRFVRFSRRNLRGVADVGRGERLNVIASRPVTRFAGIAFEAVLIADIDRLVRAHQEGLPDIFVAGFADFRANVGRRRCGRCCHFGRRSLRRRRLLRGRRRKAKAEITDEDCGQVPCHIGRLMSERRQYCACT